MKRHSLLRDLRQRHCRSARHACRYRVMACRGSRALIYRASGRSVVALLALVATIVAGAIAVGHLLVVGIAAAVMTLAWLTFTMRITSLEPASPHGNGPASPGGTGVREPRRPLPHAPAGAAAIPLPNEQLLRRAVALAEAVACSSP